MKCRKCKCKIKKNEEICSKCGEPLKISSKKKISKKFIAQKNKQEKIKVNDEEMIKYSHRPRFLTVIMALSILVSFGTNGFFAYDIINKEPSDFSLAKIGENEVSDEEDDALQKEREEIIIAEESRKNQGYVTYLPSPDSKTEDDVVISQYDAEEMFERVCEEMGIIDADKNFYCTDISESRGNKIYSMQQTYEGYDIDGAVLTMVIDETGKFLSIGGNNIQISVI